MRKAMSISRLKETQKKNIFFLCPFYFRILPLNFSLGRLQCCRNLGPKRTEYKYAVIRTKFILTRTRNISTTLFQRARNCVTLCNFKQNAENKTNTFLLLLLPLFDQFLEPLKQPLSVSYIFKLKGRLKSEDSLQILFDAYARWVNSFV